jgi:phosphate:Na+ symporter
MTPIAATSPDWFTVGMGLFGGLALFLFGLDQLSEGLKQAAGEALKTLLTRLTSNRFLGAVTGAVVTGILNSSSVTTVLVVSFVTAGVMSLAQSVAVIMGANIGSTVTAQLLAFNLSAYALLPVAVGFLLIFAGKRGAFKYWGMIIMGLGLVFFGMGIMSDAMKPLRTYEPFVQILVRMENPILGILGGALFTGLVQSSAATVGLAITLAGDGLLTLPAGIALALGANIGTCVTALLAALGKPAEAVRAALVHVLFNVAGVILWLPLIGLLAKLAVEISPGVGDPSVPGELGAVVPRQLANANTLFNVINTLLFIGITGWFARLAEKLIPSRARKEALVTPQFLDRATLPVPAVALEQVRQELGRLGQIVRGMLVDLPECKSSLAHSVLEEIVKCARQVQTLESAILEFLGSVRQSSLTQSESETHVALMTVTIHLREICDIIADDLVPVARAAGQSSAIKFEPVVISNFYQKVQEAVQLAVQAVQHQDAQTAEAVHRMSGDVRQLADGLLARLAGNIETGNPEVAATLRVQTTFVDAVRQIFTLAKRIARNTVAETSKAPPSEK